MHLFLQLELPAEARLLPMTRRTLNGYLADAGAPEEERADVVLALDEACTNVIRHAFPRARDGRFRLAAEVRDDQVRVEVEDDGVGFNPFAALVHEIDLEDTSGRGLAIIRQLMTSVELESPTPTGGTRVLMTKALSVGRTTHGAAAG